MLKQSSKKRFNLIGIGVFFLIFSSLNFKLDSKYKRSRLSQNGLKKLSSFEIDYPKKKHGIRWGVVAAGAAAGVALTAGITRLLSTKDQGAAVLHSGASLNSSLALSCDQKEVLSCKHCARFKKPDVDDLRALQDMAKRLDVLKIRHKDLLEQQGIDCTTPTSF